MAERERVKISPKDVYRNGEYLTDDDIIEVMYAFRKGGFGGKGEKGDVGPMGPQGPIGKTGPQGPIGKTGAKGDKGDTGSRGIKGDTGAQGPQGIQGPAGKDGLNGKDGINGVDGKDGKDGVNGKSVIRVLTDKTITIPMKLSHGTGNPTNGGYTVFSLMNYAEYLDLSELQTSDNCLDGVYVSGKLSFRNFEEIDEIKVKYLDETEEIITTPYITLSTARYSTSSGSGQYNTNLIAVIYVKGKVYEYCLED